MKLLRFGPVGSEKPGILDSESRIRDLSEIVGDISGNDLGDETLAKLGKLDLEALPLAPIDARLGPCVGNVGKLLCIGLNYADHAAEAGMVLPKEPIIFFKANSSICGPNDNVEIPRNSVKTDWEVELGIVIGKHAKYCG